MQLSPQLAAKFEKLQNSYPLRRSALIPMLLYAQDEFGYVTDEMVVEIAKRLKLETVQVEETLSYYTMLHRKPIGKNHVQVCTNVSCMLRGGTELLAHAKRRLEIGNKEVTSDGVFSLEEVECIGACTGAPAIQVNYDFHENLTTLKFDRLIEELADLLAAALVADLQRQKNDTDSPALSEAMVVSPPGHDHKSSIAESRSPGSSSRST